MFILGGLCFVLIGSISRYYSTSKRSFLIYQGISCLVITILELVFGLVLNIVLKLDVWDYSNLKFNFLGQICLKYSIFWFFLSLPAIVFYDYIRYWLFGEEKPDYKLI
ncbi:putative ABC transporter permease [Tissierella sp.]|uniref:putative ABC transporter permease n=1 Tax=Tissierella sp. TaxID=41274 RepID=UPI0037DD1D0F